MKRGAHWRRNPFESSDDARRIIDFEIFNDMKLLTHEVPDMRISTIIWFIEICGLILIGSMVSEASFIRVMFRGACAYRLHAHTLIGARGLLNGMAINPPADNLHMAVGDVQTAVDSARKMTRTGLRKAMAYATANDCINAGGSGQNNGSTSVPYICRCRTHWIRNAETNEPVGIAGYTCENSQSGKTPCKNKDECDK